MRRQWAGGEGWSLGPGEGCWVSTAAGNAAQRPAPPRFLNLTSEPRKPILGTGGMHARGWPTNRPCARDPSLHVLLRRIPSEAAGTDTPKKLLEKDKDVMHKQGRQGPRQMWAQQDGPAMKQETPGPGPSDTF